MPGSSERPYRHTGGGEERVVAEEDRRRRRPCGVVGRGSLIAQPLEEQIAAATRIHWTPGGSRQRRDCPDVVSMSVRHQDGGALEAGVPQQLPDPVGLSSRVDHQRLAGTVPTHDEAVGPKGAHRQGSDAQRNESFPSNV